MLQAAQGAEAFPKAVYVPTVAHVQMPGQFAEALWQVLHLVAAAQVQMLQADQAAEAVW